jgi:hypothetical protein
MVAFIAGVTRTLAGVWSGVVKSAICEESPALDAVGADIGL